MGQVCIRVIEEVGVIGVIGVIRDIKEIGEIRQQACVVCIKGGGAPHAVFQRGGRNAR